MHQKTNVRSGSQRPSTVNGGTIVLTFILLGAAFLRFHALGLPMLLHDEALVINAATHDWGYILRRSFCTDAHPPTFYFLYKIILMVGTSEFVLRFFPALCGVMAVWLFYGLGKRFLSRGAGLVAASLLSVDMLHVALSRAVRPHALIVMLTILSLSRLMIFLESPNRRSLVLLAASNLLLSLWHFNGALIIGAQFAVLIGFGFLRRLPLKAVLAGLGVNTLCMSLLAFPILARLGKFPGVEVGEITFSWTATRTWENLQEISGIIPIPWSGLVGTALCVFGLWRCWKRFPDRAAVLAAVLLLPLAALIAARYGIIYQPQHIAFIMPPVLLFMAWGLCELPVKPEILATVLAISGAYCLFTRENTALYQENSGYINHNMCQRPIVRSLPDKPSASTIFGFYPRQEIDFVNWEYLRDGRGDLRINTILPSDKVVNFYLIKNLHHEQEASKSLFGIEKAGLEHQADISHPCGYYDISLYRIPRAQDLVVGELPQRLTVTAAPEEFFRSVHEAHDIQPEFSSLGGRIYPSAYDQQSRFSFRIDNPSHRLVPNVDIGVELDRSADDRFEVLYSFDGELPHPGVTAINAGGEGRMVLNLTRTEPFRTLELFMRMYSPSSRPSFYNIPQTLHFNALNLMFQNSDPRFDSSVPLAITGLDHLETNSEREFKWGVGPQTDLTFSLEEGRALTLDLDVRSPIAGQRIEFILNGSSVGEAFAFNDQEYHKVSIPIPARQGENILTLRYGLWNHGGHVSTSETFEKNDPRLLAASFAALRLSNARQGP